MHFLYRYAMTRNTFEPVNFVGEFYATEGGAQTGGNPLAKVWRDRDSKGPKCENAVVFDFPEEVQRAFDYSLNRAEPEDLADSCHLNEKKKVARVDDAFKHKPSFTVDAGGATRRRSRTRTSRRARTSTSRRSRSTRP